MLRTGQLFPSVLTGKRHQGLGRFPSSETPPWKPHQDHRGDAIQQKSASPGHHRRQRRLMDLEGFKSLRRVAHNGGVPISLYRPTFSLTILSPL